MKKNKGRKVLLAVAGLLSGLAMFSGNEVFAQKGVVADSNPIKTENSAEALVEKSQVIIKVVAVRDLVSGVNEYVKPKEGNKFIAVQVVVDNTNGVDDWEVIPDYFKLKDSENNTYDPPYFVLIRPALVNGIVDEGDLVKGWITFEIYKDIDIKTLRLRYEYNGFATDNYKSGWIFLSAVK